MNGTGPDNDAYLLSRLIDGDLPAAEAEALRERIANEPELRAEYEALTRLNAVLLERRKDQPEVDWDRFRATVMESIENERRPLPAPVRITDWMRGSKLAWFAAPIAAAAAVAIMVIVIRQPAQPGTDSQNTTLVHQDGVYQGQDPRHLPARPTEDPKPISIAQNDAVDTPGAISVSFAGAADTAPKPASTIQVTFSRSTKLAMAVAQRDEAERGRARIVSATPLTERRIEYIDISPL